MARSDSSPTLREIANTFRFAGWFSFWFQLVLTVISGAILLFAAVSNRNPQGTNPTTGIGVVLTVCGILVLGFNMYWSLMKYVPIGRQLRSENPAARPKKAEAIQTIRIGLMASLVGTLLALLGAEAIVGLLFGKAVNQGFAGFVNVDPAKFIQPIDILVVQASINVILAQFAAISTSLWLLNKMSKQ
ncbi:MULTISPECIES: DUF3611 family protein [Leptolyngbya]|jgi:hypothetical protein|uniref:DUF3611 family protein n=2 Tax=Leptolyngbya boryana TaxID=1184 RepID=A0A1Z4JK47_LEPBY|nr:MULTISPECIES: DUF3611 family protein [Leptolyngbya]BAY57106.1 hypothetical protein NIES2135_39700 [Leptolyngbya boryana NIES-2135]MBD1857256.1 DUF3611 family protein [Leptolyngbya sp. FACHB-1624]MBD2367140.1 DUF3611 family protein [Leptolyngbya sp. FACHB-161]MBD2373506.1 DUF3611 family protein [Leptolyngbya sp. FACHB-238]MBD2397915.1 DUF3611 family protein [Leptolyngbya sp. FACHB-239]